MAFELWDIESVNLIGRYASEAEALDVVRWSLDQFGQDSVVTWQLLRDVPDGELESIARGAALAHRALGSVRAS